MKLNKTRFLEKFVLATFPIALFVGCSATDTQSLTVDREQHKETTVKLGGISSSEPAIRTDSIATDKVEENTAVLTQVENSEVMQDSVSIMNIENPQATADNMPTNSILHFADNQYALTEEHQEALKQHLQYLQNNPGMSLELSGFSDSRGSAKNNYEISKRRARFVAEYFISNGVPESQLGVNAYGESFPLNDETNWDENRRVELSYTGHEIKDEILISAK